MRFDCDLICLDEMSVNNTTATAAYSRDRDCSSKWQAAALVVTGLRIDIEDGLARKRDVIDRAIAHLRGDPIR